jgi:phosphoglycolate phosphatase
MPAPMRPQRPRAILFDWDNTLVDSWATIHEALNTVQGAMGMPLWSLADTVARTRLSLRDSFPRLFGDRWLEAREIYLDAFARVHLDRLAPLPGRAELLAGLAATGIFLGIVSNKTGPYLRREVEHLGWGRWFGSVVGAGDAEADKPHAAPVRLALSPSGIAAGAGVWYVGDNDTDIECAVNSGCVAVLLGTATIAPSNGAAAPLAFTESAALFRFFEGL